MSYKVKLKTFEGPFDLLVYLIENARVDIYDIAISEITDQYMAYLEEMQKLDVAVGSEFMVLAANLIDIKTKMLLPRLNEEGQEMTIRGESLGGGKARLCRINGVEVDFTGEYSSIVVVQKDAPGVVAYITKCLSELGINIAFMRLFRESKGNTAYTIVESDDLVPEDIADTIRRNKNVYNVMVVQM